MSDILSERPPVLVNPRSERIRQVAALGGRSFRKRTGRILVEGPQAVRELVRFRKDMIVDVYFTEPCAQRLPELYEEALAATRWVHLVSQEVSDKISRDSQGVVAVATDDAIGEPAAYLEDVVSRASDGFSVILPALQDPGNMGTIIRSADALGARAVFVTRDSAEPRSPKVIRASAGSVFHIDLVQADLDSIFAALGSAGVGIYGTALVPNTEVLDEWMVQGDHGPLGLPHAWMFGNEARGLSPSQIDACDRLVQIEMRGPAESLNASAAAAVCLHASSFANHLT